ncbi:MAG: sigma-70 family RNA polymerase sigma factor [Phycisphaerae bacterium]|nr:sigma-70 family RNA polymerase sigma factor [Phycisphaerae bacterium]
MDDIKLYRELVLQVRQGDTGARDRLATCVRGPLEAYVYRITMREDLTQDIVQESMLEMLKILGKLSDADRFWPWLCKIAMNKIRNHYRIRERRKRAIMSRADLERSLESTRDGLENLVTEEFKQIVRTTMNMLQPKHRAVLSMRCYENMSYAQIADILDSTELNVRLMFYRGKKQLQKHLSRHGFGTGAVLSALVVFGKMTAPDTAAAAGITVLPATIEVGAVAAALGALSTKTAVVSLTAAGIITAGAIVASSPWGGAVGGLTGDGHSVAQSIPLRIDTKQTYENWYFFPEGVGGPVITRLIRTDEKGQARFQWLQNDNGNYRYETGSGTVHVTDYRSYNEDLSVRRLPTDDADLTAFLDQVEGRSVRMGHVADQAKNMLIITGGSRADQELLRLVRNYDVLQEEHFQYNWPDGAGKADGRDAMHVQGYCWFTVAGEIGGQPVNGNGFLPFYYGVSRARPAWVSIQVGRTHLFDNGAAAAVLGEDGRVNRAYPGGTFLKGLPRPWMGLHTLDLVRRDAAEFETPFETHPAGTKTQVVLNAGVHEIVYTVDLDKDWIDSVVMRSSADGRQTGRLDFEYFADANAAHADFIQPRISGSANSPTPKTLWLVDLVQGSFHLR